MKSCQENIFPGASAPKPRVSVIMATYNRSQVMRLAIASLLRSNFRDWELIVVGDACTDDSAEVVASFLDPRIAFVNLPENCGEQSGPNNEGCCRARGQYVAFLNHDDFWLPDHLDTLLDLIERERADLVFARGVSILPGGDSKILGPGPAGRYNPIADVHATLWLFRRELLADIGPWRHSRQCWAVPSQDWLIRAWRQGKKMMPSGRITVFTFHSAYYRGCYKGRTSEVHEALFDRMIREPDFRERELTRALLDASAREKSLRIGPRLAGLSRALAYRILLALRIPPVQVKYMLLSLRRGGYIRRLQRYRGSPVPSQRKRRK